MASGPAGPLRFRTPHIEELPTTSSKQAPGFAWVQVAGPHVDPAKDWGTNNRKRARNAATGQTDSQREALSARQQKEIERKIKELNSDNSKDVQIPIPKKDSGGGGGGARAGKTTNTKKILASGKTFMHYLDDEEAEIARTGRRDGDLDVVAPAQQRASKTPLARRKPREDSSVSGSPAPSAYVPPAAVPADAMDLDQEDDADGLPGLPSEAEMEALLNAPPLTYNQARSAPPPPGAPPPRRFCEARESAKYEPLCTESSSSESGQQYTTLESLLHLSFNAACDMSRDRVIDLSRIESKTVRSTRQHQQHNDTKHHETLCLTPNMGQVNSQGIDPTAPLDTTPIEQPEPEPDHRPPLSKARALAQVVESYRLLSAALRDANRAEDTYLSAEDHPAGASRRATDVRNLSRAGESLQAMLEECIANQMDVSYDDVEEREMLIQCMRDLEKGVQGSYARMLGRVAVEKGYVLDEERRTRMLNRREAVYRADGWIDGAIQWVHLRLAP